MPLLAAMAILCCWHRADGDDVLKPDADFKCADAGATRAHGLMQVLPTDGQAASPQKVHRRNKQRDKKAHRP
jgi:hypothetical protein